MVLLFKKVWEKYIEFFITNKILFYLMVFQMFDLGR